jgi:hypothetical protein
MKLLCHNVPQELFFFKRIKTVAYYRLNLSPAMFLIMVTLVCIASTVRAGDVVLTLEEPVANSAYTGVANIRGWVVGSAGINRVELYVDGVFSDNIPVGGRRSDVGAAYPGYPNSANSGFSMAYNYSNLTMGQHVINVRAIDQEGTVKDSSATFNVTRFDNSFIADPARISLNGATVSHNGSRSIFINNMTADGKTYDLRLDWRAAMQGYAITQITQTGQIQDFSGSYQFVGSLTNDSCGINPDNPNISGNLTINQSGGQLSGNVGDYAVSGAVDTQGNFSLTSPPKQESTDNPNCKLQSNLTQQGNFISENSNLSFNYQLVGNDPACSFECSVQYQGTIKKLNNTTTANMRSIDPGLEHSIESNGQKLLESVKERLNNAEISH